MTLASNSVSVSRGRDRPRKIISKFTWHRFYHDIWRIEPARSVTE